MMVIGYMNAIFTLHLSFYLGFFICCSNMLYNFFIFNVMCCNCLTFREAKKFVLDCNKNIESLNVSEHLLIVKQCL